MIQAIYTNGKPVLVYQLNTFIVASFRRKGNTFWPIYSSVRPSAGPSVGPPRKRHAGYTFAMMPNIHICSCVPFWKLFLLFWQRIRGLHECSTEHTSSSIIEVAVLEIIAITYWLLIIWLLSRRCTTSWFLKKQMYYSRLNSPSSFCHYGNNGDKGDKYSTRHWSNDSHRCVHTGWGCSLSLIIVVESRSTWSEHNNQ